MAKAAAAKTSASKTVLSLKVTLRGIKPPIWRRILMPASATLHDLHIAIKIAFGWHGGHLHDFAAGGLRYGDPSNTDDVEDENRLKLSALVKADINRFAYTYDFGDDWEHTILIEKAAPPAGAPAAPACIDGKRACPPEDCGGFPGYEQLLEILANPAHPEHQEQLEWVGGEFDPEKFSVADADATFAKAFRRPERGSS